MSRQTLEPKNSREVIEQVFLSPRVLDKAAFDEFTSIIKQLIERATEATQSMQASAAQADAIHRRLADSAPLIESRLTGAGAAIATLDARTADVRAALAKAAECAVRAEAAQTSAERIATEGALQVESRLAAATQSGQNTLENARAAVEVRAREVAESALRAIEAAGSRLADIEAQSAARLTAVVEQASKSLRDLEEQLNQVTARITTLAGAGLGGIAALCDRAISILGYDPSSQRPGAPRPGSLAAVVERAALQDGNRLGTRVPVLAGWESSPDSFDPTEPFINDEEPAPAKRRGRAKRLSAKKRPATKKRAASKKRRR